MTASKAHYHTTIDLKDRHQRVFWTLKLDVDYDTLKEAIEEVGPEAEDVIRHFEQLRGARARRPARAARPSSRTRG